MRKRTFLKLAEFQTEQSARHLNEVRSIHTEMRGYKHDFHNHLQTLKGQLEAGEVERALTYIEELDTQLMTVDTLLKTGNITLDAILSAKIAQAKASGIAVTVKAKRVRKQLFILVTDWHPAGSAMRFWCLTAEVLCSTEAMKNWWRIKRENIFCGMHRRSIIHYRV